MRHRSLHNLKVATVQQEDAHGCGVACLAMIAATTYPIARNTFQRLGFGVKRRNKPAFSSNFSELMSGLREHGISCEMKRWRGWEHHPEDSLCILKVANGRKNSWHWVVTEPHSEFQVVVHDPDIAQLSYMKPPAGTSGWPFDAFEPFGYFIRILPG
ncbi:cysteine peptidase family C39 domain-containing protein [Pseudomonas aeruginosa]|uniref:cysteine peptidase family C39 domain-containing protein n=1 Tax=Pseudomonas aeruginosa TaxID=287 RepID=UPI003B00028A